ncbi:MAG TPA: TadE family protein [Propionibacteriaceae bacterium]|nr:TadE family protein [Propionibacteriaceae bacterium]
MKRFRGERGVAAVEFALVLPVLLMLVLGIVEFGRAYHIQTSLSLAAREGVRSMALTNNVATAKATARAAASTVAVTDGQIDILLSDGTSSTPTTCAVVATAATPTVHVTITYPMPYITRFFGTSVTLKGRAAMRCNG